MDGSVEEPLAPALGALAVARILFDVGDQASIEDALPVACGVKAAIKVQVRAFEVHPHRFCYPLQRFQPLWEQDHIGLVDGCDGHWSQHIAVVICDGNDFLPLLVFVPRVPDAIAPFLATVLVPSPCRILVSRCFSAARCRTLATNACQSDPSSAHLAKTL